MSEITEMKDEIAEKLDEMADLCEIWKRNRDKGHTPNGVRHALMSVVNEIVMMESIKRINEGITQMPDGLTATRKEQ